MEEVDFWETQSDTMMLRHDRQTYPPRFEIALMETDHSQNAAAKITVKGAIENLCTRILLKSNNLGN